MPIALWTWVGPKIDHVLGGAQITPRGKDNFWVVTHRNTLDYVSSK